MMVCKCEGLYIFYKLWIAARILDVDLRRQRHWLVTQAPAQAGDVYMAQTSDQMTVRAGSEFMMSSAAFGELEFFHGVLFVGLAHYREVGAVLVGTAAQNSLVGEETLQRHDKLL